MTLARTPVKRKKYLQNMFRLLRYRVFRCRRERFNTTKKKNRRREGLRGTDTRGFALLQLGRRSRKTGSILASSERGVPQGGGEWPWEVPPRELYVTQARLATPSQVWARLFESLLRPMSPLAVRHPKATPSQVVRLPDWEEAGVPRLSATGWSRRPSAAPARLRASSPASSSRHRAANRSRACGVLQGCWTCVITRSSLWGKEHR